MKHQGTVKLATKRLVLRPFQASDLDDMYTNWCRDDQVTRYLTWPTHQSKSQTQAVLDMWISNYQDDDNYQWCIEFQDNHQAIGSIGVTTVDEKIEAAAIGYCISRNYWNQGITSEAFEAIIKFLFEQVGVNRIYAHHDVKNPNSGKVMAKVGLKYEGTLKAAALNNTGVCDVAVYGLIKSEYARART